MKWYTIAIILFAFLIPSVSAMNFMCLFDSNDTTYRTLDFTVTPSSPDMVTIVYFGDGYGYVAAPSVSHTYDSTGSYNISILEFNDTAMNYNEYDHYVVLGV